MKSTPPDALGRLLAARPLVDLADALRQNESVLVSGLWGSSVAAVVTAVAAGTQKPFLLVCGHLDEADDLADDIELFSGTRPDVLPALELAGSLGRASEEQVSNRLQLLARLALAEGKGERGQGSTKAGLPRSSDLLTPDRSALSPTRIVAPIQALMQSVPSKSQLVELIFTISKSQKIEPEKLIVWLAEHGYNRLDQVEVPGDFAVRGGIVDIYLPGDHAKSDDPNAEHTIGLSIRVDFFDDQIESIKRFNLDTLGSAGSLDSARILDLKGLLPDTKDSTSILSYLPADTLVAFWAPLEIAEQAKSYIDRLPETRGIYPLASILSNVQPFTRLELSQFDQGGTSLIGSNTTPHIKLPVETLQRFETEAKKAINELAEFSATHEITIFCENDGEKERFTELLETHEKGLSSKVSVGLGYLHRGFIWSSENDESGTQNDERKSTSSFNAPRSSLAFLGHHELFHRYEVRRRVKKIVASRPVDSFMDLKVGDYVVHVSHGIAKFTGIQTINKEGRSEEYLTLRFADDAALHVPVSRIGLIQRYVGGFTGHPTLSRLGSGVWEKQKAKVSEAVMDMAAELLEVQAARAGQPGIPYPPDTEWQREFEAEFPYQPTDDQVTGATEIKLDMQKPRPMDRLLCGDVGYGKTELAMRAAFKCVEYGKQVAILVPTTVLAEQHYRSFKERMANYPFNVDVISRFKSGKEQKETVAKLKKGEVDVVIGTHRLLSKDVDFADLGLVVIDEEQRFGVTHKERFKQMRKTVDVLTMSATPIPRTLHMSMLGLRDISSLTTAPQDRRSIVTEVMAFDRNRVKMAIQRELQREGQVYFVHNRVSNILEMADEVQKMIPDARILVGHGQMGDGELEEVMTRFVRHEADILVCTTIIESGLDIPNANTIIINNADRFGLSELHQLRGRVGRYKHRAYCYLLLPADRPVTPIAAKRLKAIEEYSHLGAGFKIAMRDLELRGAGNILGPEQSGHIAAVGYEMYCNLLEDATRQIKKEAKPITPEAHVDIGLSAVIPKTYIPGDRQRLDLYRRISRCTSIEMVHELQKDMHDAFGESPRPVTLLFALTELKMLAGHFGIDSILKQPPDLILTVRDAARCQIGLTGAPGTIRVIDEKTVYLRMPTTFIEAEPCLLTLRNLMYQAWEREKRGEPAPAVQPAPIVAKAHAKVGSAPQAKKPEPAPPRGSADYEKLVTLRDQGILTDEEFQAALRRLAGSSKR